MAVEEVTVQIEQKQAQLDSIEDELTSKQEVFRVAKAGPSSIINEIIRSGSTRTGVEDFCNANDTQVKNIAGSIKSILKDFTEKRSDSEILDLLKVEGVDIDALSDEDLRDTAKQKIADLNDTYIGLLQNNSKKFTVHEKIDKLCDFILAPLDKTLAEVPTKEEIVTLKETKNALAKEIKELEKKETKERELLALKAVSAEDTQARITKERGEREAERAKKAFAEEKIDEGTAKAVSDLYKLIFTDESEGGLLPLAEAFPEGSIKILRDANKKKWREFQNKLLDENPEAGVFLGVLTKDKTTGEIGIKEKDFKGMLNSLLEGFYKPPEGDVGVRYNFGKLVSDFSARFDPEIAKQITRTSKFTFKDAEQLAKERQVFTEAISLTINKVPDKKFCETELPIPETEEKLDKMTLIQKNNVIEKLFDTLKIDKQVLKDIDRADKLLVDNILNSFMDKSAKCEVIAPAFKEGLIASVTEALGTPDLIEDESFTKKAINKLRGRNPQDRTFLEGALMNLATVHAPELKAEISKMTFTKMKQKIEDFRKIQEDELAAKKEAEEKAISKTKIKPIAKTQKDRIKLLESAKTIKELEGIYKEFTEPQQKKLQLQFVTRATEIKKFGPETPAKSIKRSPVSEKLEEEIGEKAKKIALKEAREKEKSEIKFVKSGPQKKGRGRPKKTR